MRKQGHDVALKLHKYLPCIAPNNAQGSIQNHGLFFT